MIAHVPAFKASCAAVRTPSKSFLTPWYSLAACRFPYLTPGALGRRYNSPTMQVFTFRPSLVVTQLYGLRVRNLLLLRLTHRGGLGLTGTAIRSPRG